MSDEENNKKFTFPDFLIWLQGVEDMQPENWVPDARQWKRIREKLNTVEEEEVENPYHRPAMVQHRPQPMMHSYAGGVYGTEDMTVTPSSAPSSLPTPEQMANRAMPRLDRPPTNDPTSSTFA